MASVYRPWHTRRDGKRVRAKTYRIAYRDENGNRQVVPGYRDKAASDEKARQLERDAERMRAGLRVAEHAQLRRPITELTDLWIAEMIRLGRSESYIREQKRQLAKLVAECHWTCLAQVRVDGLDRFLADLRAKGRSPSSLNSYRGALHTFLNWCVRPQGWLEANPLAGHRKARAPGGKKTKPRRAYTAAEFERLLAAARRQRRLVYLVAGLSGFRRRELRLMEKRDLTPVGPQPTWHLRAEITKGKRLDIVPMLPECTEALAAHWSALPTSTSRVFRRVPKIDTLYTDLARAKIDRLDDQGRCVDFHALRYFFCTQLASYLPIQVVRLLMRHKDIQQTCNLYLDLGLTDVRESMLKLPRLLSAGALQTALPNATGTRGKKP